MRLGCLVILFSSILTWNWSSILFRLACIVVNPRQMVTSYRFNPGFIISSQLSSKYSHLTLIMSHFCAMFHDIFVALSCNEFIPSPIELLAVEQKKRPGSRCLIFNRNEIVCFWQDLYFDSSGSLFRRGEFFVIRSLVKPFYMWAQRESSSSSCQCLQIQNDILPWSPGIWNYLTHMMNASFKGFFAYPNVAPTDIGSITFG